MGSSRRLAPRLSPTGEDTTPAPPPVAEVVLPDAPAPETGPPADPWQPDMTEDQWSAAANSIGIGVGEFRQHFAPAKEVHDTFGVEPLMHVFEERGLVNPADGIRALGKFGDDLRTWRAAHAKALGTLPKGTAVNVSPLAGEALERAIDELTFRYLPRQYGRLKAAGVLQSPEFRQVAIRMAQEHHRYTTSLPALERATKAHVSAQGATREREAMQRVAPQVQQMSEAEYQAEVGALWDQLADDDRNGRNTEALKGKIQRLQESRHRR